MTTLRAPFPYFGGKSRIADRIWQAFGDVDNYVEPFFGSGAVLLARPTAPRIETVNDLDGLLCNFWRAVRSAPNEVAYHADWPVSEADLHPRHVTLVARRRELTERLMGDPDYFDAQIAGWWVWGACSWIGSGWCSGEGPWTIEDGRLVNRAHLGDAGQGVHRNRAHLGDAGQGVHRKRAHLGNACGLAAEFGALAERLRHVRIICGSWERVMVPSMTRLGSTAVLFDPPYMGLSSHETLYSSISDHGTITDDVVSWCLEHQDNPRLRIIVTEYEGNCDRLDDAGWRVWAWKSVGMERSEDALANTARERVWLSPHCLDDPQGSLFGDLS